MSTHKRDAPLTAAPEPHLDPLPAPSLDDAATARRDQRFEEGVRTLRVGRTRFRLEERILMIVGGIVAPIGIIVVLLGWVGASRTPHVFEQVPYLISGGILGLALVFLGAFFYFAHWMTQMVKESRAQSAAILQAFERLQDEIRSLSGPGTAAPVSGNGSHPNGTGEPVLVATERGTMAHRPWCSVTSGKPGLRTVTPADGLAACKLCDPYGP